MSKFKGGLLGNAVLMMFLIVGFFIFMTIQFFIDNAKISAITDFAIYMDTDDRGSEIFVLLDSKNNIDKISAISAENYEEYLDLSDLENSVDKLSRIEGNYSLTISDKKSIGSGGVNLYVVDIPIPGGEVEKLKVTK